MANLDPITIGKYAMQAGLPIAAVPVAVAVALAESGGNPNSDNGLAAGLWQINYKVHTQYTAGMLKDPLANAKAMVTVSRNGTDWSPWSVHPSSASRGIAAPSGIQRYNQFFLQTKGIDWGKLLPFAPGGTGQGLVVPDQLIDPLKPFTAIPAAITATQKWLSDRHNIMRLVYSGLGFGLLYVSAYMLLGGAVFAGAKKVLGSDAAKVIKKVVPAGKISKIVKAGTNG